MIKIFADGADLASIEKYNDNPLINGFTTNPSLMRKAGVKDYLQFVKDACKIVGNKPISFEVLSEDFEEVKRQAWLLSEQGDNVFVKIPVMQTNGKDNLDAIHALWLSQVKVNVTAVTTTNQIGDCANILGRNGQRAIISVFCGRIADTGKNPIEIMAYALSQRSNYDLLWASTREVFHVYQAESVGADIITVPYDILKKLELRGMDLTIMSLETVRMFDRDAKEAGYSL